MAVFHSCLGEMTTLKHLVDSKIESKLETLHACVGG